MTGTYHQSMVHVREPELPYVLLTPVDSSPNEEMLITHWSDVDTWTEWFNSVRESDVIDPISGEIVTPRDIVSLDIETRGTNPVDPESVIVGIGFSHGRSSLYIDVAGLAPSVQHTLTHRIEQLPAVIGHNIYFDWSFLRAHWGCEPKWTACTYGLYRQLATEGFFGQRWGLKSAQKDLLRWRNTNEEELDKWLLENVEPKNISREQKEGYYPYGMGKDGEPRYATPDKSKMYLAPRDILGYYCALDCDSTWQLYTYVLAPVQEQFPELVRYHAEEYLNLVDVLVTQKLHGIRVDLRQLQQHADSLRNRMDEIYSELIAHPEASPHINEWEKAKMWEHRGKEPAKFKKSKPIPKEPAKLKKDGTPSKNWINWNERIQSGHYEPEISLNWVKWQQKLDKIQAGELPEYRFNIASGKQLQWLLYEKIFDYARIRDHSERNNGAIELYVPTENGTRAVELDMTDAGELPTDAKALQQMGEVGAILCRYADAAKELSYVEAYIELAIPEGESHYGTLHPSFRVPGTLTGRLSGNAPNLQQIPKSRGTLDCFIPRPGYVFVQCDHTALENVVLAELSGDSKLMELYGPGADPHDSYLYNAAEMYKASGVEIFREIAAQYAPDPELVRTLKKKFKNVRGIAKKTTLSKNYGIGAEKLYKDLLLQGADVTREDVVDIHRAYDEVYSGVSTWGEQLREEWRVNGGWIYSGLGRPLGVSERKVKDLVNQCCQATGHDIHMKYVYYLTQLLEDIEWYPIVIDFHDESIIEVPEEHAEEILDIMENDVYNILNEEIGGIIPLSGGGMIAESFSPIKLED